MSQYKQLGVVTDVVSNVMKMYLVGSHGRGRLELAHQRSEFDGVSAVLQQLYIQQHSTRKDVYNDDREREQLINTGILNSHIKK